MTTRNRDMPAMPLPSKNLAHGLTKRDLFAMAAMQGILSDPNSSYVGADIIANYSVEAADALLAELDKDGGDV